MKIASYLDSKQGLVNAFHHGGKCDLHIVDGNLDQYQYLQILEEKLLPYLWTTTTGLIWC
jgi:hypothetical protein